MRKHHRRELTSSSKRAALESFQFNALEIVFRNKLQQSRKDCTRMSYGLIFRLQGAVFMPVF
jgi:hypothetical protein